jgi:Putative threonine efflux protein
LCLVVCFTRKYRINLFKMVLFAAGIALSLIGSLPPGLISLTVAQAAIARGVAAAMALAVGAAFAEFFQALAAVAFSDWFLQNPSAERLFQMAAAPVFLILGAYFFFFAKSQPKSSQNLSAKKLWGYFGKGVAVSSFNLLAVPYWFVYCGWLKVEGWWQDGWGHTFLFAFGVTVGTTAALGLYAWLGQLALRRSEKASRWANRFIGIIFWALGLRLMASFF